MTRERFLERFTSRPEGVLVIEQDGRAWRLDGQPLTATDRESVAGRDPFASQLAGIDPEAGDDLRHN